jgi:hypothetical protein
MGCENIRSPRQDGGNAEHWTPEMMEGAEPYPLPEVPPEEPSPRDQPLAPTREEGRGQTIEGNQPEDA